MFGGARADHQLFCVYKVHAKKADGERWKLEAQLEHPPSQDSISDQILAPCA